MLSIETTGPEQAKTRAPNAAAAVGAVRPALVSARLRRKRNMPSAAIGSGSATQRLNETTSDGSSRIASVIGIIN